MRFLAVGVWLVLFVVGGVGVAPLVAAAAEPQAAAPVAAAEKEKPQNEKSVAEQIPWPEQRELPMLKPIRTVSAPPKMTLSMTMSHTWYAANNPKKIGATSR